MNPRFGPAGNSDSFYSSGFDSTVQAPEYLFKMDLDAYEYQGGRGITITEEKAKKLGEKAKEFGIALSVHAPYYISLSGTLEEKRLGSIRYIMQSARAARWMGATRVIIHAGSASKISRIEALELAKQTLSLALDELDTEGLSDIHLCPETMGKTNQLGSLEEVVELCELDERLIPCIDFGHLNARSFGGLSTPHAFEQIFDTIENKLGSERLKSFHSHFSKIEYTEKGGEKRHLTFEDTIYGPSFEPVANLVVKKGCYPVFICESSGTQAEDAVIMKNIYLTEAEKVDG
jgi:deoxyribonuclease-4